jgi:hypothetical protein
MQLRGATRPDASAPPVVTAAPVPPVKKN